MLGREGGLFQGGNGHQSFSCRREGPTEDNWSHKLMWAQSTVRQGTQACHLTFLSPNSRLQCQSNNTMGEIRSRGGGNQVTADSTIRCCFIPVSLFHP